MKKIKSTSVEFEVDLMPEGMASLVADVLRARDIEASSFSGGLLIVEAPKKREKAVRNFLKAVEKL